MLKKYENSRANGKQVVLAMTVAASLIAQAYAQEAPAADSAPIATVQVTGYRASLLSSAKDKKEAVGFQDTISSEDFGKFPDKNIAESLSRIPGVQIARDVTGEGMNVQIRGLGSSFTKVLLNNTQIAVASSGPADGANSNREIDLDLLPTDLFTKLTVSKSPTADMLEGGAAGIVNLRSARPFDNPGRFTAVSATATKQHIADKVGGRGSILASQTFGDKFGILAGISFNRQESRTSGFETVGWTNPNLSAAQSSSATRNNTGGGNYAIPAKVPAGAGAGLKADEVINEAWLLANNPGRTIEQIDNAILPRLGRHMDFFGTRDKGAAIISAEYRPAENLHFYLDGMYSQREDNMQRISYNWAVRNNAPIPTNMTVDREDCANGCVVTGGTFGNVRHFIEFGPRYDKVTLKGLNPGMEWKITPTLILDAQANYTKSKFVHEAPTVMPITKEGIGNTVTYANNGGVPTIEHSIDLNDPANYTWSGGRVNVQNELRETMTKGFHSNLMWGDAAFNIKAGVAYDDIDRSIRGQDNSAAWQAAICGNNPSVFLQGPNGAPPCNGANTPGLSYAGASGLYPAYGTGYSAGQTTPLVYQGSLVPEAALAGYIVPGPYGRPVIDWENLRPASNYDFYNDNAPDTGSSSTGASSGYVREKATGFYTEVSGMVKPWGMQLRYNAGVRYVKTKQTVGAFNSQSDPRNGTLQNGAKYPNTSTWVYQETNYSNTLPSATAALTLHKDVVARAALSRTMTRANPNALRPGINFSSVSADVGTIGSPGLKPYLSDNIDLGLDWYTGREGYISATVFQKEVAGFTVQENLTLPFKALEAYGVTYNNLIPNQQVAITQRGGPDVATVVMSQERNAGGILRVRGLELGWVQPLDKLLPIRGFGFNETVTFIQQRASGEGTTGYVALGVPKRTNSFAIYYENHGYMARLSHIYSQGSQVASANQSGITAAALYGADYKQADFSSSIDLDKVLDREGWPTLTFDIVNLNKAKRRSYFQFSNATMNQYDPGRTFSIGVRAKF